MTICPICPIDALIPRTSFDMRRLYGLLSYASNSTKGLTRKYWFPPTSEGLTARRIGIYRRLGDERKGLRLKGVRLKVEVGDVECEMGRKCCVKALRSRMAAIVSVAKRMMSVRSVSVRCCVSSQIVTAYSIILSPQGSEVVP